jgi:hypothetical protein
MTTDRHGLSIGIERVDSEFFLALKAVEKLTHQDYEVITPLLEAALLVFNAYQKPGSDLLNASAFSKRAFGCSLASHCLRRVTCQRLLPMHSPIQNRAHHLLDSFP